MLRQKGWNIGFYQSSWLDIAWIAFGLIPLLTILAFFFPTYSTITHSIEETRQIEGEFAIEHDSSPGSVSSEAIKEIESSFLGLAIVVLGCAVLVRVFTWWLAAKLGEAVRKAIETDGDCYCWRCGFYLRAHDNLSSCPKCGHAAEESREICAQWLNRPLWRRVVLT